MRYYERIGLMPKPSRTASNYRNFGPEHIERLSFIRRAREIGFSIGEHGLVSGNPFAAVRMASAPVRERFLTKEEAGNLLDAISDLQEEGACSGTFADASVGRSEVRPPVNNAAPLATVVPRKRRRLMPSRVSLEIP